MNLTAMAKLDHFQSELEANVRDELAKHSDDELMQLVMQHLFNPEGTIIAALSMNPGKLCTMAAVTIFRERLRRQELAAMEDDHA